ncbi:hypothetical protein BHE74_00055974, partial [Ensete ventricosum]
RQVTEAHAASQTPAPARSQSRSCDLVQIGPDFDTLSSDTADCQREQVCQVHQRFDEVQKDVLKSRGEIGESSKGSSSFTPEIQGKPLPATFKLPTLEPYDGSDDPTKHIAAFRAQMALYDTSDALMCRAFPTMLRGPARTCECTPQTDHRLPLGVGPRERRAPLPVCGMVYLTGPRNSRPPSIPSHPGILDRTETVEFLLVTDRATARNTTRDVVTGASIHGRRNVSDRQAGRDEVPPSGAAPRTPPIATEEEGGQIRHVAVKTPLILLNSTRTEIFFQIREKGLLKTPNPMKSHSKRRDKRRYCRFHREYGHDTEKCRDLQYQIEDLIRRVHLRRYVRDQFSLPDS